MCELKALRPSVWWLILILKKSKQSFQIYSSMKLLIFNHWDQYMSYCTHPLASDNTQRAFKHFHLQVDLSTAFSLQVIHSNAAILIFEVVFMDLNLHKPHIYPYFYSYSRQRVVTLVEPR